MPTEVALRSTSTPTVVSGHTVVQGVRCPYLEAGDGPPLVLLHGTAFDSAALSYGPILPALAERNRVLARDWPGYGESEIPGRASSMDDHVDLLVAFLNEHAVDRAHLTGFSMGAAVALGYALRHPQRGASLTMIGSYGLDARIPVPLVPYLAMRVPLLQRGVVRKAARRGGPPHAPPARPSRPGGVVAQGTGRSRAVASLAARRRAALRELGPARSAHAGSATSGS